MFARLATVLVQLATLACALALSVSCSRCDRDESGSARATGATSPVAVLPAPSSSAAPSPSNRSNQVRNLELEGEDDTTPEPTTLEEQRTILFSRMGKRLGLSEQELAKLQAIFAKSKLLGQGNPEATRHPMTGAECRAKRRDFGELPQGHPRCGKPNMVPLFDPSGGQTVEDARVCIDQYEFPNLACEYPVVYARASEVVEICAALGKRICDAHEWEGACAGALRPPEREYAFGQRRMMMEYLHNKEREITWAYGAEKDHRRCATGSRKSPKCLAGGWSLCGSNTYPAGAFPECRSSLGVFDLHGNAAEHMNLPILPEQLASRGGLGETEMKGSWFIFSTTEAHLDDCRWRAPMWHRTRVADENSHSNYHLGFRCCRDL